MRVVDTSIEQIGTATIRVTTTIELSPDGGDAKTVWAPELGDGPTGDAVPDQIVRYLIESRPGFVALSDIKRALGGHPGTVARQAWTLAANAPDLQHRLRGWVVKVDRGRYALSQAALARLDSDGGE